MFQAHIFVSIPNTYHYPFHSCICGNTKASILLLNHFRQKIDQIQQMKIKSFLHNRKYELLLLALIQHLFIGIFLNDLPFYTKVIWPINMLILGIASAGIFIRQGKGKNIVRNLLALIVLSLTLAMPFLGKMHFFMITLNISYVVFFSYILFAVIKFLIKPSYVNIDIISASVCGYFLLLEISVFLLQIYVYQNPHSFKGIDPSNPASIFIDLVYLCSMTLTSIGFGDITPNTHHTRLIISCIGIAGQFYSVGLVGILFSKFTSKEIEKEQALNEKESK